MAILSSCPPVLLLTWKAGNCFSRWSCASTERKVPILFSRCGGILLSNVPSLVRNSLCRLENLNNNLTTTVHCTDDDAALASVPSQTRP